MPFFRRMEVLDHTKPEFKGTHQPHIRVVPYPLDNDVIFVSIFWEDDGKTYAAPQALTPQQAIELGNYLVKWGNKPTTEQTEDEVIKI